MTILAASFSYPGLTRMQSVHVRLPVGRRAGRTVIRNANLADVPQPVGTLVITEVQAAPPATRVLTMPDCRLVNLSGSAGSDRRPGQQIILEDRRWKWDHFFIDGRYNTLKEDGTTREHELAPQSMATKLLQAMEESDFNVAALPNDPRPQVEWKSANAADELDKLCSLLGCVITLDLQGDVVLRPVGVPKDPPRVLPPWMKHAAIAVKAAPLPKRLRCVGGAVWFEVWWILEPVAEDTDGTIKKLNDVTYNPAGVGNPFELVSYKMYESSFNGTYSRDGRDREKRKLARQEVFRRYRIKSIIGGGGLNSWNPPGWTETGATDLTNIKQLLPLKPHRVDSYTDPDLGLKHKPPEVYGEFFDDVNWQKENKQATVEVGYSIDAVRGIVSFERPITKQQTDPNYRRVAADLRLRCVVTPQHPETNNPIYYDRSRDNPDATATTYGAGEAVTRQPRLILKYKTTYDDQDNATFDSNRTLINAEMDGYLDYLEDRFTVSDGGVFTHAGILLQELDGDIHDLQWRAGAAQSRTIIGWNHQTIPADPDVFTQQAESAAISEIVKESSGVKLEASIDTQYQIA